MPQNQAQQQGGVGSQPGQSLATLHMPMEEGGSVLAEGNSSPLQGHTVKGTDSGPQGGAQRDPVPSNHTGVKDLNTSKPSVDKGLPPEGDCGPALSASKGPCKDTDASQRAPLPESKGEKSEHKEEVSLTAELAASEVSSPEWGHGGGHVLSPSQLLSLWLVLTQATVSSSLCHYDSGFG